MAEPITPEVTITPVEPQPATVVPDYDAQFLAAVEEQERADRNREGYLKRTGKTEEEQKVIDQASIDAAVAEAIQKALPRLQSSLVEDNVESALNELSDGNEAKKKLIRFHFENSVGTYGTIRERMENATLIADKKTILKTQKEMAVALQNRQGLSNSGIGTSTDGPQVEDRFFSQDQVNELKAKGWDDKKIQRLKETMRK